MPITSRQRNAPSTLYPTYLTLPPSIPSQITLSEAKTLLALLSQSSLLPQIMPLFSLTNQIPFADFQEICDKWFFKENSGQMLGIVDINQEIAGCIDGGFFCAKVDSDIECVVNRLEKGYGIDAQKNGEVVSEQRGLRDFWEWVQRFSQDKAKMDDLGIISKVDFLKLRKYENVRIFDHLVYDNEERKQALAMCGWSQLNINYQYKDYISLFDNQELKQNLEAQSNIFRKIALAVFHFQFDLAYQFSEIPHCEGIDSKYFMEIQYIKGILVGFKNIQKLLQKDTQLQKYFYMYDNDNSQKMLDQLFEESCNEKVSLLDMKHVMGKQSNLLQNTSQTYLDQILSLGSKCLRFQIIRNTLSFLRLMCSEAQFTQPYLKAISDFLAQENFYTSASILNDTQISFFDRIGFALRFFHNDMLKDFFNKYIQKAQEEGLLEVIILEGNSEQSVNILQTYLDLTSDIQTVGLAACHLKFMKFPKQPLLTSWFKIYRELLNKLSLWEARAHIDQYYNLLELSVNEKAQKIKYHCSQDIIDQQISLKCYFCTCSIAHNVLLNELGHKKKGFNIFSRTEKGNINNCPDCLKPLPNCAICLLPTSIVNTYIELNEKLKKCTIFMSANVKKVSLADCRNINDSIAWCQSCKHGGHYKHISEWFSKYNECPVTDCPCQCFHLN